MLQKLPVPPRSVEDRLPIHNDPLPQHSQSPEALGEARFKASELFLTGNDVLAWEGRFHEAPLLRELRIGWSSTKYLPEDINTLRHLKNLIVLNVYLFEFPMWVCEMTHLHYLAVRGTNITHIPEEISNLTNLRRLDLGNNVLSRFDADMRRCRKLMSLAIPDNDLEELPSKLPPHTGMGLAGTPFRTYTGFLFKDLPRD